jgi:hypothetical protein
MFSLPGNVRSIMERGMVDLHFSSSMARFERVEYAPGGSMPASEDFPIFAAAIPHFFGTGRRSAAAPVTLAP